MIPTIYDHKLVEAAAKILDEHPDTDFYVLRHPDCSLPPLRRPNAIHRVLPVVPRGRLSLLDVGVFPDPRTLT